MQSYFFIIWIFSIIFLTSCGGASSDSECSNTSSQACTSKSDIPTQVVTASSASNSSSSSLLLSSSSTSSSNSIASSMASSSSCRLPEGSIFINCMASQWNDLSSIEQVDNNSSSYEIFDGTQGQAAIWQMLTDVDINHDKVIALQFKNTGAFNALIQIKANSNTSIADSVKNYLTGNIIFDIKVINTGKYSPKLGVSLNCGLPCTKNLYQFNMPPLNEWTLLSVPVASLVDNNDLSSIQAGFQLLIEPNKQNGVELLLDNIRWEKAVGISSSSVGSSSSNTSNSSINSSSSSSLSSVALSSSVPSSAVSSSAISSASTGASSSTTSLASSSAVATSSSSSALVISSAKSSESSVASSAISSAQTSSSSSLATISSSSSSSSNSSASNCSASIQDKTFTTNFGVGLALDQKIYVSAILSNSSYVEPVELSSPGADITLNSSQSNRYVYSVAPANGTSIKTNDTLTLKFKYLVTNSNNTGTLTIKTYDTVSAAMSDSFVLSTSSTSLPIGSLTCK